MPVTHDAEQASVAYGAAAEDIFPLSDYIAEVAQLQPWIQDSGHAAA